MDGASGSDKRGRHEGAFNLHSFSQLAGRGGGGGQKHHWVPKIILIVCKLMGKWSYFSLDVLPRWTVSEWVYDLKRWCQVFFNRALCSFCKLCCLELSSQKYFNISWSDLIWSRRANKMQWQTCDNIYQLLGKYWVLCISPTVAWQPCRGTLPHLSRVFLIFALKNVGFLPFFHLVWLSLHVLWHKPIRVESALEVQEGWHFNSFLRVLLIYF